MSFRNRDRDVGGWDSTDLACPPSKGGMGTKILLGFGLPGWFLYWAVSAWLSQHAWMPNRGSGTLFLGPSARSLAIASAGIALFCHARWFWGLRGNDRIFELLTLLASLVILGGLLGMFWLEFGG